MRLSILTLVLITVAASACTVKNPPRTDARVVYNNAPRGNYYPDSNRHNGYNWYERKELREDQRNLQQDRRDYQQDRRYYYNH